MSFKKKNITLTPVNKVTWFLTSLLWFIALIVISYIWFFIFDSFWNQKYSIYDEIKSNLNKNLSNIENKIVEIKKQEPEIEKYNILLTWVWWWKHDAPDLTDTIILASINTKKNVITMLSIPRDLYVNQWEKKRWKINEIYIKNMWHPRDEKAWMIALENKITEITWEKIDYYVNVDFEWFKKIVDLFNWIEVEVPETIIDNEYPNGNWGYTVFTLKKWNWTLNWETALKYARSRHSTSDFDRSLRQQIVLKALKDKISNQGFLKNAIKVKELYDIFKEYIKTDLDLDTIIKLATIWWDTEWAKTKILSSNLNNTCLSWNINCEKWWFLYTPDRELFGGMSILLPNSSTSKEMDNYSDIIKFSDMMFNNTDIYTEDYKINVFNSIKWWQYASEVAWNLKKYWFNVPKTNSIWNTKQDIYEKSIIYYNDIPESSETLKTLKKMLNIETEKLNLPKYAKENDTKIEIIIWKDYLNDYNKKSKNNTWTKNEEKIFNF